MDDIDWKAKAQAAEQALSELKGEAVKAQRALAYIVGVAEEGYRGHAIIDLDPGEWSDLQSALSSLHEKLSSDVFPESPSGDVSTHAAGEGEDVCPDCGLDWCGATCGRWPKGSVDA